jgi:hypothetical protein
MRSFSHNRLASAGTDSRRKPSGNVRTAVTLTANFR